IPSVLRTSPRASMAVAPMHRCTGRAFHHHRGAASDVKSKRGEVAACNSALRLRGDGAHAPPNLQTGMPSRFRLVSEIVLNSRAREMHDADRQKLEQGIVPLERRRFGMLGPIWLAFHRTAEDWIVRMVAGRNGG